MSTTKYRETKIKEALDALGDEITKLRLPFRDSHEEFPVVKVPLDAIVLNHRSHRIKAHLESDEQAEVVAANPTSEDAQEAIASVIRGLDGFGELLRSLEGEGQRDAGVITTKGLLVNANRRAVAMREAGFTHIEVAVLPSDASDSEIDRLELQLQVRVDFKQDYTFTNQLLFVEDLVNEYDYSPEDVARELAWVSVDDNKEVKKAVARVEQSQRMLQLIRRLQEIGGGKPPLTFFDDRRQAMLELDDELESLGDDQSNRLDVFNLRMVGMLVGLGYAPLRQVSVDYGDILQTHLEDSDMFAPLVEELSGPTEAGKSSVDGLEVLEDLSGDKVEDGVLNTRALLDFVLEPRREGSVKLPGPGNPVSYDAGSLGDALMPVMTDAADDHRDEKNMGANLQAPLKYAKDARKKLQRAQSQYAKVRDKPGFKVGKLNFELDHLIKEAQDFRKNLP